jgi:uncharacterized protein
MWQDKLVSDDAEVRRVAAAVRRVVVLGIKPDSRAAAPAHYVPAYLARMGIELVPVPVYYPGVTEILGYPVQRDLRAIEGEVDMVDVFRRSGDVAGHVDDLIALRPPVVWLQRGIRNDAAAERLAREGIRVVQDRCLMVEHRRALGAVEDGHALG